MTTIEQYYEDYWQSPDAYHDPSTPARQRLLLKSLAALPGGSRVLDVGCGRGEFCEFFRQQGFHAVGSDISETAIRHASEAYPGITFHAGPIEGLVAAYDESFDVVFSSEVIEHLFDVPGYLLTINRLLKPGGLFILTTPYHGFAKNVLIDLFGFAKHYDPFGQHIRFFDRVGMRRCLHTFGFVSIRWAGYGRPWPLWKSMFVVARKTCEAQPLLFGTQGRHA
jgi:SAM-dependent methyltransferase